MTLELDALEVRVGEATLLEAVRLVVSPGELVVIIGPNGAGKSTLCRVIAGDVSPTRGVVRLEGRSLAQWPRRELAQRRAFLPQESALSLPFAVERVARLGRAPHPGGGEAPEDVQIAREALQRFDVAALAERPYPTLSGGEKQRTQLARVLAQVWRGGAGHVLVLDEPTASLDPAHQIAALDAVRDWTRRGGATVLTVHDLHLAGRYADRIVLLSRGRVAASGSATEVLAGEALAEAFALPLCVMHHPVHGTPVVVPR